MRRSWTMLVSVGMLLIILFLAAMSVRGLVWSGPATGSEGSVTLGLKDGCFYLERLKTTEHYYSDGFEGQPDPSWSMTISEWGLATHYEHVSGRLRLRGLTMVSRNTEGWQVSILPFVLL